MARFLRTQPRSVLRPPTVVGSATTFRPPQVTLSRRDPKRRGGRRLIAPGPAYLNPSIVFRPPVAKLAAVETRQGLARRSARSRLTTPVTFEALVAFLAYPVRVSLAKLAVRPRGKGALRPPAVVAPPIVFLPPDVRLSPSSRGKPKSRLAAPAVVGAPIVFRSPQVSSAAVKTRGTVGQRKVQSRLSPPATLQAAVLFFAYPVRVALAASTARFGLVRRAPRSRLFPPAVVAASVVFRAPLAKLAALETRLGLGRRGARSKLAPPTTLAAAVAFLAYPVKVALARRLPTTQWKVRSRLAPPTVVAAAVVFRRPVAALVATVTRTGMLRRNARSTLAREIPVLAFLARPVQRLLAVAQTRDRYKRQTRVRVGKPAAVGAAVVFRPVVRALVARTSLQRVRRPGKSRLFPPNLETAVYIVVGFFRRGRPGGPDAGTPDSTTFDGPAPGGPDAGSPEGDFYDRGTPGQGF